MTGKHAPVAERLYRRVNKTSSCWLWTGCVNRSGYGKINVDGKIRLAHRIAYELAHGPIPYGLHACHKCDTPACVNPDHIFLGTQKDNSVDMAKKGRAPRMRGELCGKAKLKTRQVIDILGRIATGEPAPHIARHYGVGNTIIYGIKHGTRWAHLPRPF